MYSVEEIITEGDMVVIRWTMRGTHDGEYAGLAPTGTEVEVTGIHIHRIECGQIVETWNEGDALGLYQQIGLLPAPIGATPEAADEVSPASPLAGTPASCPPASPTGNQALI